MKISDEFPPNYEAIKTAFPNCDKQQTVFAYGDTIYNPFKGQVTPDLEVHESVHSERQGNKPTEWWQSYITDVAFRLQQELEAYGAQYKYLKKTFPRKISDYFKRQIAFALSGELYGNMISYHKAESLLNKFTKNG